MAASSGQPKLPSEPLGVRSNVVGSRFVVLTWDPPVQRHGAVLAYHIFYREQDSSRLLYTLISDIILCTKWEGFTN